MISFAEARSIIESQRLPARKNEEALERCLGRVLAESVTSHLDFPRFDNSAMDGFAIGGSEGPWKVVRDIPAGASTGAALQPREAVRIFTGAPTPAGTFAVIAQEDALLEGELLSGSAREGSHIRRQGEEMGVGTQVCEAGQIITPAVVAALSALGMSAVPIVVPPRVAAMGTGDEIVMPGEPLADAQIYDSNQAAIRATFRNWNIEVATTCVEDDPARLGGSMDSLLEENDVVMSTGGVSVGARDYMLDVMLNRGFELHFHGVAMKPGKPLAFATRSDGKAWFGLPGNPLSTWTGLLLFVAPYIGRTLRTETSPLAKPVSRKAGREEFVPFWFDEQRRVVIKETVGSHSSFGLVGSDGLVQIPAARTQLNPGEELVVHLFPWEANS